MQWWGSALIWECGLEWPFDKLDSLIFFDKITALYKTATKSTECYIDHVLTLTTPKLKGCSALLVTL